MSPAGRARDRHAESHRRDGNLPRIAGHICDTRRRGCAVQSAAPRAKCWRLQNARGYHATSSAGRSSRLRDRSPRCTNFADGTSGSSGTSEPAASFALLPASAGGAHGVRPENRAPARTTAASPAAVSARVHARRRCGSAGRQSKALGLACSRSGWLEGLHPCTAECDAACRGRGIFGQDGFDGEPGGPDQ
jgi:hypothetical protein